MSLKSNISVFSLHTNIQKKDHSDNLIIVSYDTIGKTQYVCSKGMNGRREGGGKERQRAKNKKEGRGQKEGSVDKVVTGSAFCNT